jgi:serine/threonine protein kinase
MGRTRRRHFRGGDAISGQQGCVIVPSLLVDTKMRTRNANYVTKIFFKDQYFEDEKKSNDLVLSSIDPRGTFTSAAYTTTPVDATPKESASCEDLKGKDIKTLKYLNYKFLGKSIADIINNDMKITTDLSRAIIAGIANLSVKLLYMNNNLKKFHNDIHEGNIMFNFKEEHAYLIDFGGLSDTPINGNQLTDFQGLVTVLRLFAISTVSQEKLPKPLIEHLNSFIKDSSLTLVRSADQEPNNARALISKFLTDFSLKYTTSVGGRRRKTLRRSRH